MIFNGEREAVKKTIEYADSYGYGNLIAWLALKWKQKLVAGGLPEDAALKAVSNRTPYDNEPFELEG